MKSLVLATSNTGKIREIGHVLATSGWHVAPQSRFDIPPIDETGETFVENAILKARNAARYSGLPAVADDSGLEVDGLNGAPGVRSSRYAGATATDLDNIERLLRELKETGGSRRARFVCVIVFLRNATDPTPLICQGLWSGVIAEAPRGARGFGYDPIFFLPSLERTAAELDANQKNDLSHRGQALRCLVKSLQTEDRE